MATCPDDTAREVKRVVEGIHAALLRAHRTLSRAPVRPQPERGIVGRGNKADTETSLSQRFHTDRYRDLVVLGFWHDGLRTARYVCSSSGVSIVRAVREVARRALAHGSSWGLEDRAGAYREFLQLAQKLEPDLQEIDPELRRPTSRHERDMLRMQRALGMAFHVSEAEARMASYLIRRDVKAVVHTYATHSASGVCCRTFADLAPRLEQARQRRQPAPAATAELSGFRWRMGWLLYGQRNIVGNANNATDFRALDDAIKARSIEGHAQL